MVDPASQPPHVPGLTGLTVLARGGYATVYRAIQESVGRDVAVKVENRRLESDRDQRRFLREARAAGRMSSHPHVVDLFDAGVTGTGHPYLIMELCEGSYSERMRTTPLTPQEAREVGFKIADALADAHALGVLHRDVKPANILYSRFNEPALADFGLAVLAEHRDHSITLDVLTPAYAPPEMFRSAPPGPGADVYALCATLYALMQGRPPRWRDDRTPSMLSLVDMFHRPIPDLPGVPPQMMELLRRGMANDEHRRPTALELRDALQAMVLDPPPPTVAPLGLHTPHIPAPRSTDGAADARIADHDTVPHGVDPTPPGLPTIPPPPGRPSRRLRRWSMAAGGALVIAALGVLAWGAPRIGPLRGVFVAPSSTAPSTPSAGPTRLAGCGSLPLDSGVSCPAQPECYDEVKLAGDIATARRIDCNDRHRWEVFALGQLPPELKTVDHSDVAAHAAVRRTCGVLALTAIGGIDKAKWQTEVLPPTPDALKQRDRTYRCLAGNGTVLDGPQLKIPPR